jgi:hypothetical protein
MRRLFTAFGGTALPWSGRRCGHHVCCKLDISQVTILMLQRVNARLDKEDFIQKSVVRPDSDLREARMAKQFRQNWYRKIAAVIRSRHYTWLGRGLGGAPIDKAMITMTADVMHICKQQGIDVNWLIEQSKAKFEQEQRQLKNPSCLPIPLVSSDTPNQTAA